MMFSSHSSLPHAVPANQAMSITQGPSPLHRSLFNVQISPSTSPTNIPTHETIHLASRATLAKEDPNPASERLELASSPTLIFRPPSGVLAPYQSDLSHHDHPSPSPEPDHYYVTRAYGPYRSWPRVYEHLGIRDTAQEAFRQTVIDIKDASLAAKFAPHSIEKTDFAPDDASWELFDGLVEDWLMKWGPVMWSDRRGTMANMREAWVGDSERGSQIKKGRWGGTFKEAPSPHDERDGEQVREASDVDPENESEDKEETAEEVSEDADEFDNEVDQQVADHEEETDEWAQEMTEKSGLWWNDKKDRKRIQLTIRELFKYMGNNAYDSSGRKNLRNKKSGGEPTRKKVKPCIRQYIEEHGLALTKSTAAPCLKRSSREEDVQSLHDGDLNQDVVEQQPEERREEKKVKYWSGRERDGGVGEMERKYPYGFGLGIWEKLRRGEYTARDGSVVENNGIENGRDSGVEHDEAQFNYESRWPAWRNMG